LFDVNGRLMTKQDHTLRVGPNQIPIDLKGFVDQLYFLHWQTLEEKGVQKLMLH